MKSLFIVCCCLTALIGLSGCRKVIRIDVDQSLAPSTAVTAPGQTLEWVATSAGESFTVVPDPGLCAESSSLDASYDRPAKCKVARQTFGSDKQPIAYGYFFEGHVHGKPTRSPKYMVRVGPGSCTHCR